MGVTGARAQSSSVAPELVRRLRTTEPSVRIGVGLGVSDGAQAAEVAAYADAVIVGSALVATLLAAEDGGNPSDFSGLRAKVADLAAGVRFRSRSDDRTESVPGESPAPGTSPAAVGLVEL
jgi:tryptophan synthase alpha chain